MKRRTSAELKSLAREALLGNYGTFIGATLIYGLITILCSCLPTFIIPNNSSYGMVALRMLIAFLLGLIISVLAAGISKIALSISRHEAFSVGDLFHAFRHHPDRFVILGLLLSLLSTVCMIPASLSSYFVIASSGSVMETFGALMLTMVLMLACSILYVILTLAFSMSTILLVDYDDISAIESLKESMRLMRGNKWRYFYITNLSFIGLTILSMFGLYIPLLWLYPYIAVTQAFFYREINQEI